MKTKEQIDKKIKRIKPRFKILSTPSDIPLSQSLNNEMYKLLGMIIALRWVNRK